MTSVDNTQKASRIESIIPLGTHQIMQNYLYTSLICILTVFLMLGLTFNVGIARGKYQVKAPASVGLS